MGAADLLGQEIADRKDLTEFTDMIITAARKAAALTQQLLAFSRKGTIQKTPIDIDKVITDAVRMLERSIDKRVSIEYIPAKGTILVNGDASQIESALLNLGLNARDAMPDGGILRFETKLVELSPDFCFRSGFSADRDGLLKSYVPIPVKE